MKSRILQVLLLIAAVSACGCTLSLFTPDRREAIWRGWKQDIHEWNNFMDKFIFNYDETDPNRY